MRRAGLLFVKTKGRVFGFVSKMGHLVYQCAEKMGTFRWETKVYAAGENSEDDILIEQTWTEGQKIMAKQSVMLTKTELKEIVRKI
jgi:hypothetical protein